LEQRLYVFVERGDRQLVLHNVICLVVAPHTPASQKYFEAEKQMIVTWCKVGIAWSMLEIFPLQLFE
jgi:hypothetical protein